MLLLHPIRVYKAANIKALKNIVKNIKANYEHINKQQRCSFFNNIFYW